jgi:hypothetical protein
MNGLPLAVFLQLAAACAPGMPANQPADFAQVESGRDPLSINVNGPGGGELHFRTMDEAVARATRLISAGRSAGLGIMQLNSAHLDESRMLQTIAEAMEPCRNIQAGAAVLATADRQAACIYNRGRPGFLNSYPEKIQAASAIAATAPPRHSLHGCSHPLLTTPAERSFGSGRRSTWTYLKWLLGGQPGCRRASRQRRARMKPLTPTAEAQR